MKRIRIVGLCLVAVFAVCAIGVSSASALEYRVCIKASPKNTGNFSDKGCTVAAPGTGKYTLGTFEQAKKKVSKSKGTHPVNNLVNPSTKKVEGVTECKKEKGTAEITSAKTAKVENSYSKCSSAGKTCETAGAGKGNIKTHVLTSTLVPISAGTGDGVVFTPASGAVLAEYNCEGIEITAEGAPIGEMVGLNGAASKTWTTILQQRGGVPGNLQQYVYIGGAGTEAEEEEATDSVEFEVCLKSNTKAVCEAAVGDGKEPAKPVMGFSIIGPPFNAVAPFDQNNTTTSKGEVTKIV
jgi:hypothetical protein